jgi:ribosomal protein S18 acetylase RimI-like enzyme
MSPGADPSAGPNESPVISVPASEAGWDELQAVFGTRGSAARCQCQRYKLHPREHFAGFPVEERADRLRVATARGGPGAEGTTGLVGYRDGVPVGWCAVEPRTAYRGLLRNNRVPWQGRSEDKQDPSVWVVTCFVTRTGHRRRGVASALAKAAVGHAQSRGARVLEGYPVTRTYVLLEELHVGTVGMFAAAGFVEVSRPTPRRAVMQVVL